MADNISYIHSNKLAKHNYRYYGKDGTIYIGQKDGRLLKVEDATIDWGKILGDIKNQKDLTSYITNVVNNIVNNTTINNTTIVGGDATDYTFLLMGA